MAQDAPHACTSSRNERVTMNIFALSLFFSITPPEETTANSDDAVAEAKSDPKFLFNLTAGMLESFSPVTGDHYGFYLSLSGDFLIPVGQRGTTLILSPGFEVGELGTDGLQWGPVGGFIVDQVIAEKPKVTVAVEPQVGYVLNAVSLFDEGGVDSVSHFLYTGLGFAFILPKGLTFIPTVTVSIAHTFDPATVAINPMFLISIPLYPR